MDVNLFKLNQNRMLLYSLEKYPIADNYLRAIEYEF
jgi:hypothetical protein